MSVPIAGVPGYPVIFKTLLMVFVIAGLAGCGTFRNQMAPKQSFNTDKDIKELEIAFGKASSIKEYYEGQQTEKKRDKFITGRLVLINIHYIQFIRKFAANKAQLDTATDMLQLGVDLAITVVGGAAVKAALGAASAGITGTRISISKNFFYEKTVPVLITAMNAQRKVALVPIIAGIQKNTKNYPLAQAVSDLESYYFAGTFVGALQAIQKNSAEKEAKADEKIKTLTFQFDDDGNTKLLEKFLKLDPVTHKRDPTNEGLLIAWMKKNGLKNPKRNITVLLFSKAMAGARQKAVKDLKLEP